MINSVANLERLDAATFKNGIELPDLKFALIFTPTPYKMVFREPEVAKAFDRCFDRAYAEGGVTRMDEKYIGRLQQSLGFRYLGL